jgi:hypothetical protein
VLLFLAESVPPLIRPCVSRCLEMPDQFPAASGRELLIKFNNNALVSGHYYLYSCLFILCTPPQKYIHYGNQSRFRLPVLQQCLRFKLICIATNLRANK